MVVGGLVLSVWGGFKRKVVTALFALVMLGAATLTVTDSGRTSDQTATATVGIVSPAAVTVTKTVAGGGHPGDTMTYTVVLSNSSASAQSDNPGAELTDVLPPQKT